MNPIVRCKSVTKTYQQGKVEVPALRGVDLEIGGAEFISLSGPSGSGKTTLLNVIGGLDRPTSGAVTVAGLDLAELGKSELAEMRLRRVGFVFQAYNLIPVLNAIENVEFILQLQNVSKAERRGRAEEILQAVGLAGMENRRPAELSGGQQQRVAVARAMVSRPAILLADEPTANLDSQTAGELLGLMQKLNESHGSTFIVSTHDPKVIAFTRRKIRLVDGQVAEDRV